MDGPPLRSGRRAGLPATGGWPLPWPWLSWAVLAVLLAVGLTLGSGALAGAGPRTPAQRIAALDQVIGCPSCADLSVAESNAASAVAIRQFVAAQVRAGRSDRAVERAVEASYGPAILLAPPSSGPGALVWVLPAVLVAVAVGALLALFEVRRRRGGAAVRASDEDRALVEEALRG